MSTSSPAYQRERGGEGGGAPRGGKGNRGGQGEDGAGHEFEGGFRLAMSDESMSMSLASRRPREFCRWQRRSSQNSKREWDILEEGKETRREQTSSRQLYIFPTRGLVVLFRYTPSPRDAPLHLIVMRGHLES